MTSVPSWFSVLMTLRKAMSGSRPAPAAWSGYISILTPHSDIRITRSQGGGRRGTTPWWRGGRGAVQASASAAGRGGGARRGSGQRFGGGAGRGGQRAGDPVDGRVIMRRGQEPGLVA